MADTGKRVTFKNVCAGHFESYLDGVKTRFGIVNGSLGVSGRNTANMYGVTWTTADGEDKRKWVGPLRTCKIMIEQTLLKETAAGGAR
jgi:hypothetical protein